MQLDLIDRVGEQYGKDLPLPLGLVDGGDQGAAAMIQMGL
jgi:hypothetical protein